MRLPPQKLPTVTLLPLLIKQSDVRVFRSSLRRWFTRHQRDLPWRRRQDEYAVFVSEIMLQQTQVSRVIPAFEHFLRLFPSFQALARAPQADVVRAWKGLGYNRRARALHRAAQIVVAEFAGRLPSDDASLRSLPGIGAYTSQAIRAFVFNEPVLAIDTNAQRILARYFYNHDALSPQQARGVAPHLERANLGGRVDAASLMDFGALVCTSRLPKCAVCPLRPTCQSAARWLQAEGAAQRPTKRRASVPFRTTDRFLRGRIIDALRDRGHTFDDLHAQLLVVRPELGRQKLAQVLHSLSEEQLIRPTKKGAKTLYFLA